VLTVRKAVSLGISVWYYGTGVNAGLLVGGGLVMGEPPSGQAAGMSGADGSGDNHLLRVWADHRRREGEEGVIYSMRMYLPGRRRPTTAA